MYCTFILYTSLILFNLLISIKFFSGFSSFGFLKDIGGITAILKTARLLVKTALEYRSKSFQK